MGHEDRLYWYKETKLPVAPLIGIYSPYPQSGKSTFARALEHHFPKVRRVSFADPLRETVATMVSELLEGGEDEAYDWLADGRKDTKEVPGLGVTLRRMLQTIGTEWGRNTIHPDIWVKIAAARIRRAPSGVIVDDLRMENEYALLKKLGATLVKVVRPGLPVTAVHESNARLENMMFDYTIDNDGDEEDLKFKALVLSWKLGG